jgi:hypothetical protein
MALQKETRQEHSLAEPEFDSVDAGWDPYVASLLERDAAREQAATKEDDETAPVMTISRLEGRTR